MTPNRFFQLCGGRQPLRIALTADGETRTVTLATPFVRIGSDPRADLVLAGIAALECAFVFVEGNLFALPLCPSSTLAARWVDPESTFELGGVSLQVLNPVQSPDAAESSPLDRDAGSVPTVQFEAHGGFQSRKPLDVGSRLMLIGRDDPAKFKINHPSVRPTHAAILRTAAGPWLIDLTLAGETLLNEASIAATPLRHGDRVSIGEVELTARVPDRPAAASTAVAPLDTAVGPILQQVAQFQQQTFEQFREMLGSMTEMFGSVLNEHRQFVREEFARLERIGGTPAPANPAAPQIAPPPTARPPVYIPPSLPETVEHIHAPNPGGSAPPANAGMHLWVQEQIGNLEKNQSTRWQRLLEKFRGH